MNDKAIRDIFVAYLQATNHETRIYQEKSIGSSICDVMAVTDKLIGYSDQKYLVQMGDSPNGNARRVLNTLIGFRKIVDNDKEHLDKIVARKTELQRMVQTPDNTYAERLTECEKEANELRQIIAQNTE